MGFFSRAINADLENDVWRIPDGISVRQGKKGTPCVVLYQWWVFKIYLLFFLSEDDKKFTNTPYFLKCLGFFFPKSFGGPKL